MNIYNTDCQIPVNFKDYKAIQIVFSELIALSIVLYICLDVLLNLCVRIGYS